MILRVILDGGILPAFLRGVAAAVDTLLVVVCCKISRKRRKDDIPFFLGIGAFDVAADNHTSQYINLGN